MDSPTFREVTIFFKKSTKIPVCENIETSVFLVIYGNDAAQPLVGQKVRYQIV
jgi:hypothetical protein